MDDYSGAAAMYGLALLNSDYTGNAITVRRASDNATQDIGFDGQDLDIAALESFCSGTDGFVSVWFDQSGNGLNTTQTTASAQPQIVSSGSVLLENGKAIISYDGIDDSLNFISSISNTQMTIVDVTNTSDVYLASNSNYFAHFTNFRLRIPPTNYDFDTKPIGHKLSFFSCDGSTAQQNYNGGTPVSKSLTSSILLDYTGRYFTNYYPLTIQCLIIYTSDQSGNRTGIETALNDYYSIY